MSEESQIQSREAWSFEPGRPVRGMAVSGGTGRSAVADANGTVYVLDRAGTLLSTRSLPVPIAGLCASYNGDVFAGMDDEGALTGFAPNGEQAWKLRLGRDVSGFDMGVSGKLVVAAKGSAGVYAVGLGVPSRELRCEFRVSSVALAENYSNCVLAASDSGHIALLDAVGTVMWQHNIVARCGPARISNSTGIITLPAHDRGFQAFTVEGQGAGAFDIGQPISAAATAATSVGPLFAVLTEQNTLVLLDADGVVLWYRRFTEPVSDFAITGDASTIVVALGYDRLVGLELAHPWQPPVEAAAPAGEPGEEVEDLVALAEQSEEIPVVAGPPRPRGAALLYTRELAREGAPVGLADLTVTPQGRFTAVALEDGLVTVLNRDGEPVAETRLEQPVELAGKRSDVGIAAWSPGSLIGIEFDSGETRALPLGPPAARLLDCSADLGRVALVDDADELVVLDRSGGEPARTRVEPPPVDLLMSPGGDTVLTVDAEGRYRFFDTKGNLLRKQRLAGAERFPHVVLEDAFCALAGSRGTVVVQDQRGNQRLWSRKVADEVSRMESLGRSLAIYDGSGLCLLLSPYGDRLAELRPPPGRFLLRAPLGGRPLVLHGWRNVLTAFRGHLRKLTATWRFECEQDISHFDADRDARFVAIVAGSRLYFIDTSGERGTSQGEAGC